MTHTGPSQNRAKAIHGWIRVTGVKTWTRKMDTDRIPERLKTLLTNKRILVLISGH